MASIFLMLVEIGVLVIASPVPQDLLFTDNLQDPGASLYPETLFEPIGGGMTDSNVFFSNLDPSTPDDLLYAEMIPGEMAIPDQATSWNQPDLLNQEGLPAKNIYDQMSHPDMVEIPDLDMAGNDCVSDVIETIGKIRHRRSCPGLKKIKPEKEICPRNRAQLACCTGGGLAGVYHYGCKPCMQSPRSD
jgi:hypothetical protein